LPHYLYIKTHNQTGLKYLGKTERDPIKYKGSGVQWLDHIKEHGYDVDTEILGSYETKQELETCSLFYSKIFDAVKSHEWANLIHEDGTGGKYGYTPEVREKMRLSKLGKKRPPRSKEWRENLRLAHLKRRQEVKN
jgi:hypothetical protein